MLWRASEDSIRRSVRSALMLAQEHGFRSIAFPLIGAGSGGFTPEAARRIMDEELLAAKSPLHIKLVIYERSV